MAPGSEINADELNANGKRNGWEKKNELVFFIYLLTIIIVKRFGCCVKINIVLGMHY